LAQGDRWFRGRTNNPWNPQRGSSGSSAGPASATAAGCVAFAIGTETLGSIVSPTRRCGLNALRPTFGRVSRAGCMSLAYSMDKAGPMCRSALDCALVFAAIHGADAGDPSTLTAPFRFDPNVDLSKLRIGYDSRVDKDLLAVLRELGADPKEIGPRPATRAGRGGGARGGGARGGYGGAAAGGRGGEGRGGGSRRAGMMSILTVESAMAFHDFLAAKLDEKMVEKRRVRGWRDAQQVSAVDYLNAQRQRYQLMQKMAEFMEDWDLYVSSGGDLQLTNLTGHPSAVLPYTFDRGQPQCTMINGKLFGDDLILSVAHAYQRKTDWHTRRPDLS
jgi:Asp-tRNA(Asn)/Glu-tRNA(Gln) amidotransferase A subunit family amidase